MTQPTGVFVRLPLSEEQVLSVLDSYTGDRKTTNDAMQKAICDLGTPVDSSVPVVGYVPDEEFPLHGTEEDDTFYTEMTGGRQAENDIPLVRQSDHQAALAAAQADSVDRHEVKDSKALGEAVVAFKLMAGYSDLERVRAAVSAYFKALKGPEA